jgi:23S rRNA (cytidine1920-2'-O)/16S rRNA (cytidine1409-2'-O)-methyltransferase
LSQLCHDDAVTTTARRPKVRLDQLLVERALAPSRARAQALLMAGRVRVGEPGRERSDRHAGDLVDPAVPVTIAEPEPYVSRGGHKLAAGLDAFEIDPAGRVCLDVGASTGGFTDVLLQRGAARVYAVDVGRGQLAESLRRDPRVVSMERTNARTLSPASIPEPVSLATVDVSFISLRLVLGPISDCFGSPGGDIVALVKPQFEAGRAAVRRGVVRDPAVHRAVVEEVMAAAADRGLVPVGLVASPILGPEGNREFLLHLAVGRPTARSVGTGLVAEVTGA